MSSGNVMGGSIMLYSALIEVLSSVQVMAWARSLPLKTMQHVHPCSPPADQDNVCSVQRMHQYNIRIV